ncbi:MAG: iron ABC transporter permease [Phycisphaeraceae bacterium]|nr:iron ABC transporter permease [Phycisphaeraceae bacterium]
MVSQYGLLGACVVVLALFLLYPIALTLWGGLEASPGSGEWTFEHIGLVLKNPVLTEGLVNSLKVAMATTLLAILIALPLAVLSAQCAFPLKRLLNGAVLVPLILPPFVGAIGMRALLGREGSLNALLGTDFDILGHGKFWGVVVVEALHLYPIIFLNATASLANLDPALDEAATNLGAGWATRFRRITLPLLRPGLFAGATIVFIWSFTELGTPLIFDYYRVTPVQIYDGLKEVESSAQPYALTIVLLATAIALYLVGKVLLGRRGHVMETRAARAAVERRLTGASGWLAAGVFGLVTLLAVLPHLGVIATSVAPLGSWYDSVVPQSFTLSHFQAALTHEDSFAAIRNSLVLSLLAMVGATGAGLVIAYLLVRTTVRGKALLDALSMLPLAVPGLVLAFGYVAMTLRWPLGRGDPLEGLVSVVSAQPNPFPLLVIAYAVRRLPYVVRSCVSGLEQTSGSLEEAAMNLGASRLTAIRRVVVPLIMANLIAGGLLVFSFSMLEVSDSMILAQQQAHYPITKAIFMFTGRLGDGPAIASAMGVWGMALLTLTLMGASLMLGKKLGSIFRA